MEPTTSTIPETKYQKLATEYSKLRAQASVLRKAVLEEQAKNVNLRESIRQRETALRRSEQEVDSLGFRNKQLQQRVGALQDEIAKHEGRKKSNDKDQKRAAKGNSSMSQQHNHQQVENGGVEKAQDALIFDELQKKIIENAQLTLLIEDKERDLLLYSERITSLEQTLEKRTSEHVELEKRLRRDLETLQCRNADLETKLVDAASMLGSEDALSVSGSDHTPLHNSLFNHMPSMSSASTSHTNDDRIAFLEKEISHWRTQYEITKLSEAYVNDNKESIAKSQGNTVPNMNSAGGGDHSCSCSLTAAGIFVKPSYAESKSAQRARDSLKEPTIPPTKEQLIYDNFCKKYEDLLKAKYIAESRLQSYETETEHLQNCLENATHELKSKDGHIQNINRALQMLEDDLATTRHNYEEQISVLTEQVISLSEQLASK